MEVEDEVQLTDTVEVLVQHFDEMVHRFERHQLVVFLVHDADEIETGILFVHDLEFLPVQEVAQLARSRQDDVVDFLDEPLTLARRVTVRVPLRQTDFPLAVYEEHAVDHFELIFHSVFSASSCV